MTALDEVFMCISPVFSKTGQLVNCGSCIECSLQKSREWAYRVTLESQNYEQNCMITLTYNDENLPKNSYLNKKDFQLFMKRLREFIQPRKIRFFGCGEYGSNDTYIDIKGKKRRGTARPHYHIIIFNYKPDDLYFFFKDKKGTDLFRSPTLEKLWTKGHSTVGEVTFDTAKYCAIYLQKKNEKGGKPNPFLLMSRKPAIGTVNLNPKWLETDKIYVDGHYLKLPRIFLDKFEKNGFENEVALLKFNRNQKMKNRYLVDKVVRCDTETGELYLDGYFDFDTFKYDWFVRVKKFLRIFGKEDIFFGKHLTPNVVCDIIKDAEELCVKV